MDLSLQACWDCGAGYVVFYIAVYFFLLGVPLGMIFASRILNRLGELPRLAQFLLFTGVIVLPMSALLVIRDFLRGF